MTTSRATILLAILTAVFAFSQATFGTVDNLVNIVDQTSLLGFMTVGMMLAVITGNIDLSVGSVAAVGGVVFASLSGWPLWISGTVAIAAGALFGLLNGILVGKFRFNAIVVTLATMALAGGFALWISHGYPISGESDNFEMLGGGFLLYVPLPIVYFSGCLLVSAFILRQTPFGRNLYAIGNNIELARLCDIPVTSSIVAVYVLSAALSAFAGIVLASRMNTASPLVGQDAPLQALVAVVIGGTALSGGQGGVGNTLLGLFIAKVLENGLNLWNIAPANRWGITGALLILFAALDRRGLHER